MWRMRLWGFTVKINSKIKLEAKLHCIKKNDDETFGSGKVEKGEEMRRKRSNMCEEPEN